MAKNLDKTRTGPKPFVPTTRQRHEVELAVAVGMSLETIADALDVSRRTLGRAFARELAVGRSKRLLASAVRLDKLAEAGNVAAV
jgi:AraC-like DNA-binding protein